MKKNILDDIGDTKEAAERWGMSIPNVKKLAQSGKINAKKIGAGWVIDMTQPNPQKYETKGALRLKYIEEIKIFLSLGEASLVFNTDTKEVEVEAVPRADSINHGPYTVVDQILSDWECECGQGFDEECDQCLGRVEYYLDKIEDLLS